MYIYLKNNIYLTIAYLKKCVRMFPFSL